MFDKMSNQSALDASGGLKDAKDIDFYESESDICSIPKPSTSVHEGECT
jgi:hypothetical protein